MLTVGERVRLCKSWPFSFGVVKIYASWNFARVAYAFSTPPPLPFLLLFNQKWDSTVNYPSGWDRSRDDKVLFFWCARRRVAPTSAANDFSDCQFHGRYIGIDVEVGSYLQHLQFVWIKFDKSIVKNNYEIIIVERLKTVNDKRY